MNLRSEGFFGMAHTFSLLRDHVQEIFKLRHCPGGGLFRGFWVGMCPWDPVTLSCPVASLPEFCYPFLTLLAESLRFFLDKSRKRKRLCRHLQTSLICRSSRYLDESDNWRNQFICARTRTLEFC